MIEVHPSPSPSPRRRILIIDTQPLVRRGLTALIDNEPDLTVCAAAATSREGLAAIAACQPDLIITDAPPDDAEGAALVQAVSSRDTHVPVLVFTPHEAPVCARRAFQAGASGCVTKRETAATLLAAIRRVLGGDTYLRPGIDVGLDKS